MRLRKLQAKDAPLMLQWMHDGRVVRYLRGDFLNKTEDDCIEFIMGAQDETKSIHLARVDDHDEYVGTVSLKNIQKNAAELGIVVRACAMGRGYAAFGLRGVLEYGYSARGIEEVFWCVDPRNQRAMRFYDKLGFTTCGVPDKACGYSDEEKRTYVWYRTQRER